MPVRLVSLVAAALLVSSVSASAGTTASFSRESFEGASLGSIESTVLDLALNAASCAVRTGAVANP